MSRRSKAIRLIFGLESTCSSLEETGPEQTCVQAALSCARCKMDKTSSVSEQERKTNTFGPCDQHLSGVYHEYKCRVFHNHLVYRYPAKVPTKSHPVYSYMYLIRVIQLCKIIGHRYQQNKRIPVVNNRRPSHYALRYAYSLYCLQFCR